MILSLNSSALSSYSFNSSNNTKTQKTSSDSKQASSNEVLGYKVDKNGYFTEEFNEAAGIPKDIKIHSSTMQSLVRVRADDEKSNMIKSFKSIDIAKTIGNAYKVLSQVIGEDILNSKDSFTLDEIANFPQGYEYNRQSMQVSKIYNTSFDYHNGDLSFDWQNKTDTMINSLFFNTTENRMKGIAATNIFSNNNGGQEGSGVFINVNGAKYTNSDGSITKGGLLVAVMNSNLYTVEGETTHKGKIEGFDKSMSGAEVKRAREYHNTIKFDPNNPAYILGAGIIDPNAQKEWEEQFKNYKDPIAQMFEDIQKFQKEQLKHLEKQRQEQRLAQQRKRLDMKA